MIGVVPDDTLVRNVGGRIVELGGRYSRCNFGNGSDDIVEHFVISPVCQQIFLSEEGELRVVHPEQLAIVIRELVRECLSTNYGVDQLVPLIWIPVIQERTSLFHARQKACRIEVRPSDKFSIAGQRRMWNLVALHFSKDNFVNEVLSRYRRIGCRISRQCRSGRFREAAGMSRRIRRREYWCMRTFQAIVNIAWVLLVLLLLARRCLCNENER